MTQYRKLPIVVDAFQMTKERRATPEVWPQWLRQAFEKDGTVMSADYPADSPDAQLMVSTPEGAMLVGWGDWIIKGITGELYPCKPDVFEKTYEAIT